jgi:large subunit ribosomal protein L9
MKVILVRDVAKIGRRNQIVEVPDGYAQNQLIPKKWALPATPQNLKRVEALHAGVAASKDAKEGAFLAAVEKLKSSAVSISADANEQGHLFKAVHEKDIVEAAKVAGIQLDVTAIKIPAVIKSVGDHEVTLVHGSHVVPYTITIVKK